jgi:hypothetical protein
LRIPGLAIVPDLAANHPSATIYARARDPASLGAAALRAVAEKHPGRVEVVEYVAADALGNTALAQRIQRRMGGWTWSSPTPVRINL